MPYGEKLKLIKKEKHLTNAQIRDLCNIPLATVTRLFDEKNLSGNFETFVSIAKGLNISLDELAGLKPPAHTPSAELLSDKDKQIERLTEENKTLREDNQTLRDDNKTLRNDSKTLRRALATVLIALAAWLVFDLFNGYIGIIRY